MAYIPDQNEKKPSETSIVNYNGLLINHINIAQNYIDQGFSGYNQVMGLRHMLKPQYTAELSEAFYKLDKAYQPIAKKLYVAGFSVGTGTRQSFKDENIRQYIVLTKQYVWDLFTLIIACLDQHGVLEYTERDLIDSGVVH